MAKKTSEHVKYCKNPEGPVIGTVSREIIRQDGLYFKDLDGSGEFKPFDDWRRIMTVCICMSRERRTARCC